MAELWRIITISLTVRLLRWLGWTPDEVLELFGFADDG